MIKQKAKDYARTICTVVDVYKIEDAFLAGYQEEKRDIIDMVKKAYESGLNDSERLDNALLDKFEQFALLVKATIEGPTKDAAIKMLAALIAARNNNEPDSHNAQ